jgi:hypothetical protein
MYSRMREVSNRLEKMDSGRLYYDVAYKEDRPYNTKNNYMLYDELLTDHNTMYNIKNDNGNNKSKSMVDMIKGLICCI